MTIVELLVAMALLALLMTVVFGAFSSSSRLVETDVGRVNATQNTQGAMDLLVADVRQAGENLDLSLGVSGLEFGPSTLTVRRSIPPLTVRQAPSDEPGLTGQTVKTMPICFTNGANSIQIVGPAPSSSSASSTCTYSARSTDNEDVNVKLWRVYFASESDRPQAAILARPKTDSQDAQVKRVVVLRVEPTQTQGSGSNIVRRVSVTLRDPIPGGFTATNGSTLTLVDERRYFLDTTSQLRLALGGQTDSDAAIVAFNITDFTPTALIAASDTAPEATVTTMNLTGPWSRLKKVNLSLTGGNAGLGRLSQRTFSTSVFPRNVESAQ